MKKGFIFSVLIMTTVFVYSGTRVNLFSKNEKSLVINKDSSDGVKKSMKEYDKVLKEAIEWIEIPSGSFKMGSINGRLNEKPIHKVFLDTYYISKYEVTVGQFRKFVEATDYITDAEKGGGGYIIKDNDLKKISDANWKNPYFPQKNNNPVVIVSWNDATAYCKWISKKTGKNISLPTEAQWEKAARGNDGRMYPWGNNKLTGSMCNYADKNSDFKWSDKNVNDGYKYTAPVGSYSSGKSFYGVHDMAGNVWEWCLDKYDKNYYSNSPENNPIGASSGLYRVNRGGSWNNNTVFLRSTSRSGSWPANSVNFIGFRLALTMIKN